jgi:hypothetical protein
MKGLNAVLLVAFALGSLPAPASADDVRPVQLQFREREPGAFLVQWRVPPQIPFRAIPSPYLPASCSVESEPEISERAGNWVGRQEFNCPDGLAGQEVGVDYPVPNPAITTVIRVELLSGERYARQLDPLETRWSVPPPDLDPVTRWIRDAAAFTATGIRHVAGDWVHWAFILSLVLLAARFGTLSMVTLFGVGQLVAVLITSVLGRPLSPVAAEATLALAVLFLARTALVPGEDRVRWIALAAGVFHGLGLAATMPMAAEGGWLVASYLVALVLGMDAVLLLGGLALEWLGGRIPEGPRRARARTGAAYLAGIGAAAAGFGLLTGGAPAETSADSGPAIISGVGVSEAAAAGGPAQAPPQYVDAAIQSFVSIEPFEVRHEIQLQVWDVTGPLDLSSTGDVIPVADQDRVLEAARALVESSASVQIDGVAAEGFVDRVSFMVRDPQGVLPRQVAVDEPVAEALIGVTVLYIVPDMAESVSVGWEGVFDQAAAIPITLIDPEASVPLQITAGEPAVTWRNELSEDPVPTVAEVQVEPPTIPLPLASVPFLLAAIALGVSGIRRQREGLAGAGARILLAVALLVGPLAEVAVALPAGFGGVTSDSEARRILAGVLPNVYRALEIRAEEPAYDRLAVVVTGETLTDVYLEHRRALVMEERGGARARVDAVEVNGVEDVRPGDEGGFAALVTWTVGGNVTHFGHRHFRQNRYEAEVSLVPVEGVWKIRNVEVLGEERIR